jgi:hypothetical protein
VELTIIAEMFVARQIPSLLPKEWCFKRMLDGCFTSRLLFARTLVKVPRFHFDQSSSRTRSSPKADACTLVNLDLENVSSTLRNQVFAA